MNIKSTADGFDSAIAIIKAGGTVAVPTETVYGLAADATNPDAVKKIYKIKNRQESNPLIIHVDGTEMAQRYAVIDPIAEKIIKQFCPGPITLVLKSEESDIAENVRAGLQTIAIRMPIGIMNHIVHGAARPIAAPSANTSGKVSPTTAQHVQDDLGDKVDLILDGGKCNVGLESTIVKIQDGEVTLLRHGVITKEEIQKCVGVEVKQKTSPDEDGNVESPGQMERHYAPNLPIELNKKTAKKNEALLCFGPQTTQHDISLNLSETENLREAAQNFFGMLRKLDESGATKIIVQPIPMIDEGIAINDRLKRAANK